MNSPSISYADAKSIFRLLGECRELGDDYLQWRTHLFQGLACLIDADLIMHAAVNGVRESQIQMEGGYAWGFENGFNLAGWLEIVKEYGADMRSEMVQHITARIRSSLDSGVTLTRQSMIPADEWERSFDYQVIARTIGTDAVIQSWHWTTARQRTMDSMTLGRATGSRLFNEREEAIVRLIHAEIASLVGGPLASFEEPQPTQLPPRVRQVLRCLLEGDGDKQIAQRLQLSNHTVNQYTKQIFRFFCVSGRTELLARWIRRGWKLNANEWRQNSANVCY